MEKRNIYEQTFKVYSYFVDDNRKLILSNLMYFMQEAAWAHANNNQFGWHFLQTKNMFWALVKLHIHIERMPEWNESIHLKTWGKNPELIIYPRDFEIFDEEGNRIIAATSAWVILNKENFKPQKVTPENETNMILDKHAIQGKIPKIPKIDIPSSNIYHRVLHSDIDMNKHVNNTRYLMWILDEYGHNFHQQHVLKTCNIHFISQAKYGDEYSIVKKQTAAHSYISSIFSRQGNTEVCRVALDWKSNN